MRVTIHSFILGTCGRVHLPPVPGAGQGMMRTETMRADIVPMTSVDVQRLASLQDLCLSEVLYHCLPSLARFLGMFSMPSLIRTGFISALIGQVLVKGHSGPSTQEATDQSRGAGTETWKENQLPPPFLAPEGRSTTHLPMRLF